MDTEPQIICIGTTRGLRVKRVGLTYFVENAHIERDRNEHGDITWKVVAVAKGPDARNEAIEWLCQANKEVAATMEKDRKR